MKSAIFSLFENWEDDYQKAITDQIEMVCYAEELGFDEAWLTEHHFNNFSVTPSPLSVANYLLGKTKKIKIGTAGILLPYYNPIKLAEEIATIKAYDEDRFLYGIAKGAFAIYDKTFNVDALSNRELMFEANELIHRLLLEERVTFKGKFFSCEDISIRPKIKKPIPPKADIPPIKTPNVFKNPELLNPKPSPSLPNTPANNFSMTPKNEFINPGDVYKEKWNKKRR